MEIKHCVPLWPLHELSSGLGLSHEVEGKKWLLMHGDEAWAQSLAAHCGFSCIKERRNLFPKLLKDLKDGIEKARQEHTIASKPAPWEDEGPATASRREMLTNASFDKKPLLNVNLHGHCLVALNCLRPLAMEANDALRAYIQEVLVPRLYSEALEPTKSPAELVEEGSPVKQKGFEFVTTEALNVRGKVVWNPWCRAYKLMLKGPGAKDKNMDTDIEGKALKVAVGFASPIFKAERRKAFKRACEAWNAKDSSPRERIA